MSLHCNPGWVITFVVHCVCAGRNWKFSMSLWSFTEISAWPVPFLYIWDWLFEDDWENVSYSIFFSLIFYSFFHCFPFFQTHFSWQNDHLLLEHLPFFDWLTAVRHSQIVPVTMNVEFFCVTSIWGCCRPVIDAFLRFPLKPLVSIILFSSYLFSIFFGYYVEKV